MDSHRSQTRVSPRINHLWVAFGISEVVHICHFTLNAKLLKWVGCSIVAVLKIKFSQKWKFCYHLLTLMLFQTCMLFFHCETWKEIFWEMSHFSFVHTIEVNGPQSCLVTNFFLNIFCLQKYIRYIKKKYVSKILSSK